MFCQMVRVEASLGQKHCLDSLLVSFFSFFISDDEFKYRTAVNRKFYYHFVSSVTLSFLSPSGAWETWTPWKNH